MLEDQPGVIYFSDLFTFLQKQIAEDLETLGLPSQVQEAVFAGTYSPRDRDILLCHLFRFRSDRVLLFDLTNAKSVVICGGLYRSPSQTTPLATAFLSNGAADLVARNVRLEGDRWKGDSSNGRGGAGLPRVAPGRCRIGTLDV